MSDGLNTINRRWFCYIQMFILAMASCFPAQTEGQIPDQTTAETPDQTTAQTSDQTTAQTSDQTPDQTTAQTPVWEPPGVDLGNGFPFKCAVVTVDNPRRVVLQGGIDALGVNLAFRLKNALGNIPPKLIVLHLGRYSHDRQEQILAGFYKHYPSSVIVGFSGPAITTQQVTGANDTVGAMAFGGGNIRLSAAMSETSSASVAAGLFDKRLLQTNLDRAVMVFSDLPQPDVITMTQQIRKSTGNRVPVWPIAVSTQGNGTTAASENNVPTIIFGDRIYRNASVAVAISGTFPISEITLEDLDTLNRNFATDDHDYLGRTRIDPYLAILLADSTSSARTDSHKRLLQQQIGRLTPLFVCPGCSIASENNPGLQDSPDLQSNPGLQSNSGLQKNSLPKILIIQ